MRGDQSALRAHRTELIIFMTLPRTVQEMRCPLPPSFLSSSSSPYNESSPGEQRKRDRAATTLQPCYSPTTTCRLVTGIVRRLLFFASCSSFITYYYDDRRATCRINGRGRRQGGGRTGEKGGRRRREKTVDGLHQGRHVIRVNNPRASC